MSTPWGFDEAGASPFATVSTSGESPRAAALPELEEVFGLVPSTAAAEGTVGLPLAHESPEQTAARLMLSENPVPAPGTGLWVPGAERVANPRSAGGTYLDSPWRFVFHTIEGKPSAQGFRDLAASHANPPHLWAMPQANLLLQTIPLDRSAYALARPGTIQTNRYHAVQVELWGFAAEMGAASPETLAWLADRVLAPVAKLVPINLSQVSPTGPGQACSGKNSPCRMKPEEWQAFNGVTGHYRVPDNEHWDPGQLDLGAIAARARVTVGAGSYIPREHLAGHDGPAFQAERDDEDPAPDAPPSAENLAGQDGFWVPPEHHATSTRPPVTTVEAWATLARALQSTGYEANGTPTGDRERFSADWLEQESPIDKAKETIRAQAQRGGTDAAAVMSTMRALAPSEMAELTDDPAIIDILLSKLSGADLAAAGAQLARGRVGSMPHTEVNRIMSAAARYRFGTVAAAIARDVLLTHQETVDRTGTGTIHGNQCSAPKPAGATASDCTIYILDVLKRAFAAKGQSGEWAAALAEAYTRSGGPTSLKGIEVIKALQAKQGWEALFWSPDPQDPLDTQDPKFPAAEHPYAYKIVRDSGTYYGITVDRAKSVINYRRTAASNRADLSGIERLRRLQFGVLAARGGNHMALAVNGAVYEVHLKAPATDRNAIEATPLESFGFQSGTIAAPRGDLALAWRTP